MVKDYSGCFVAINGRCKIIPPKKKTTAKSRSFFSATRLMKKTLGTMLFVTVIIGISSTIYGTAGRFSCPLIKLANIQ